MTAPSAANVAWISGHVPGAPSGLKSTQNASVQGIFRQAGSNPRRIVLCKEFRAGAGRATLPSDNDRA
jgi:hypothetical protein